MNKELQNIIDTQDKVILLLVGTPLTGKDTFIRENGLLGLGFKTISRDDILMEHAAKQGITDYGEAFKKVSQKGVDAALKSRFKNYATDEDRIIINMTHMGVKRRKANLKFFNDSFYNVAIVFPFLTDEEYVRRNTKRKFEENKELPMFVVKNMMRSFQTVTGEEGFDKIITLGND